MSASTRDIARELEEARRALEGVDLSGVLDPLPDRAEAPPDNHARRFGRLKRGAPKPRQESAPPGMRDLPLFFLKQWSPARGPLFEDPCRAVCRAIALAAVTEISLGGEDPLAAHRAGRYAGEHGTHWPHAKTSATNAQFSAATMLLADLSRAARKSGGRYLTVALHNVLQDFYKGSIDATGQCGLIGWARMLAGTMSGDESLRVRAARTLLHWTVGDTRKVGRGAPLPLKAGERALDREIYDYLGEAGGHGGDELAAAPTTPDAPARETAAPT